MMIASIWYFSLIHFERFSHFSMCKVEMKREMLGYNNGDVVFYAVSYLL